MITAWWYTNHSIVDSPINTSVYSGFPIAMFDDTRGYAKPQRGAPHVFHFDLRSKAQDPAQSLGGIM
jgi:hypothetical protein